MHSVRLAGALSLAQLRVVPGLVAPVMLVMAVAAVLAAFLMAGLPGDAGAGAAAAVVGDTPVGAGRAATDATGSPVVPDASARDSVAGGPFALILLAGVALTATMAVGRAEHDAVSLATPLGPQVVMLARLALVLALDAAAGFVASAVLGVLGLGTIPVVLAGWLPSLALVAGVASFVATWAAPWAGAACGLALVPLVSPVAQGLSGFAGGIFGFGGVAAGFQETLGPAGMAALGVALLALTVATSRRALLVRESVAE